MSEPTQAELLAQLAAMQAQMAKLQQQLTAQQSGSGRHRSRRQHGGRETGRGDWW